MSKHLFIAFMPLLFLVACAAQNNAPAELLPAQFDKGISQPDIQVLDVRTSNEFTSGHLKNALLADWNNQTEFEYRIKGLDKSKPVYTYCLVGGRSAAAAKYLVDRGFTVYNLKGGIKDWKNAGLPVIAAVEVKQITEAEFKAMIPADRTVLVDVGAEWCPPCKVMNPIIDSLAKAPDAGFLLVKINGGDQPELAKTLSVDAFPTFIVYKNGIETFRTTGIVNADEIKKQL